MDLRFKKRSKHISIFKCHVSTNFVKQRFRDNKEIADTLNAAIDPEDYRKNYATIFEGDEAWKTLERFRGNEEQEKKELTNPGV